MAGKRAGHAGGRSIYFLKESRQRVETWTTLVPRVIIVDLGR